MYYANECGSFAQLYVVACSTCSIWIILIDRTHWAVNYLVSSSIRVVQLSLAEALKDQASRQSLRQHCTLDIV